MLKGGIVSFLRIYDISRAMLTGLYITPHGLMVTSNIASASRCPMLSVKHEPIITTGRLWRIIGIGLPGDIVVRKSIGINKYSLCLTLEILCVGLFGLPHLGLHQIT